MRIGNLGYYIKEGVKGVFRYKAMSLAAVISIVVALFMLGSIILFGLNVNSVIKNMESSMEIVVFLKDDMPDQDVKALGDELKNMPGVSEIKYLSKADAFEIWKQQFGDQKDYLEGYTPDNNPLPRSYDIRLKAPSYATGIINALRQKNGIDKIRYNSEVADTLTRLISGARWIGAIIVGMLLIISVVIVINTIRLAVFARRHEISIMKYIGATDWFIRWPFIVEGAVIGLIGSIISLGGLKAFYSFIISKLSNILVMIKFVPPDKAMSFMWAFIIATGLIAGIIGSALSIRRYLKV